MQIEEKPPEGVVKAPFDTPFVWIGGEERVKALVERFYDLMDLEPGYIALRAAHAGPLDNARQRLFWFLCGWMGGPQHYTERFGHPRLRMRHMPEQTGGSPIGITDTFSKTPALFSNPKMSARMKCGKIKRAIKRFTT